MESVRVTLIEVVYTEPLFIFIAPLALINHTGFPSLWSDIFWAAFFNELFWTLFILSLYKLDVTSISPFFNLRSIFSLFPR